MNKLNKLLILSAVLAWGFYFWIKFASNDWIEESKIDIRENQYLHFKPYNQNHQRNIEDMKWGWTELTKETDKEKYRKATSVPTLADLNMMHSQYIDIIFQFEEKKHDLSLFKKTFEKLQEEFLKHGVTIQKINFDESSYDKLWLELYKNKISVDKKFDSLCQISALNYNLPTSYLSNNFEGYSILAPDYENEMLLIKAFWFYEGSYYTKKDKGGYDVIRDIFITNNDKKYFLENRPRTFHIFETAKDTVLNFKGQRSDLKEEYYLEYKIPLKVIPKINKNN